MCSSGVLFPCSSRSSSVASLQVPGREGRAKEHFDSVAVRKPTVDAVPSPVFRLMARDLFISFTISFFFFLAM